MSDLAPTATLIEELLTASFNPVELFVRDDSHLHAGHAGAKDGRHFFVEIASPSFKGLTRVQQHRLVYDAVFKVFPKSVLALAI